MVSLFSSIPYLVDSYSIRCIPRVIIAVRNISMQCVYLCSANRKEFVFMLFLYMNSIDRWMLPRMLEFTRIKACLSEIPLCCLVGCGRLLITDFLEKK